MSVRIAYRVTNRGGKGWRAGEIIEVKNGSYNFGRAVEPATAAADSVLSVMTITDSTTDRMNYLRRLYIDPLVPFLITPTPGHPDHEETREPNELQRRRWFIVRQRLPADQIPKWRGGRQIFVTEAEFEAALTDSETGFSAKPNTLPRNDPS